MSDEAAQERPGLLELALTFNKIALASFGGGLSAWSREIVVVERKWMTEEEFLSALTICRILPGANQINLAVFVGVKFRGIAGAVVSCLGLIFVPLLIVLAMGWFYFAYSKVPAMKDVLHGVTPAAVAMTFAMAIKTGQKCLRAPMAIALFVAIFVLSAILRMPLLAALAICGPVAFWWGWPRKPREPA
ncbi:chromate transporter [Labrys miyagiensis]|uniref:Chromate transporter n=1 Tax=Labrys miyagiensis TaxID=346912 RepID=A0ABQ6CI88_9HYPH|nr:chromate transporter [Labrys miyagiensis]GLS18012.1 chromate transporter [Labrys miyagiensis]